MFFLCSPRGVFASPRRLKMASKMSPRGLQDALCFLFLSYSTNNQPYSLKFIACFCYVAYSEEKHCQSVVPHTRQGKVIIKRLRATCTSHRECTAADNLSAVEALQTVQSRLIAGHHNCRWAYPCNALHYLCFIFHHIL